MRLIDILASVLLLVLLLPLFIPIILILRITGEGEIFYLQDRVGQDGKTFKLIKFATMLKNSPNIGAGTLTMRDDPRVLPFGKFLRKSKINELPQIYNILIGDMAFVGPRPLVPEGEMHYSASASRLIRSVCPGLTGIGSIMLRDEEAIYGDREDAQAFYRDVIQPYKESLEIYYAENRSMMLDFKIIALTFVALFVPNANLETFFPNIPLKLHALGKSEVE